MHLELNFRSCIAWCAWVLLFLVASPQRTLAAGVDDPALRTQIRTLENGLTVLTLEDHATPVVSLQIWVRAGSRDETRHTGIAHLFEHMMFRGSKHIAPEQHARLIEARGGRVNAFTSQDVTVYFEDVSVESLPLALELEAERFAHLKISAATLQNEREVVLEERRLRSEDDPEGLAGETLLALAFQAHPYRRPVIGWRSDIEAVGVEECRRFFQTYYAPNNLVLLLVGDFDTQDALERVEQTFGRLKAGAQVPRNLTREPEQRGERRATPRADVRGPLVSAAWHAPASGHTDGPALDVAGQLLAGGRSSRLYQSLVYQAQQALGVSSGYWELADAGLFYADASVRPGGSVEKAEALLLGEIARLRETLVGEREIAKVKRQLEVSLLRGLETTHALAMRIGGDFVTLGRIRPLEERLAQLNAVTPADVQRVVRHYLSDDRRNVVRLIPSSVGPMPPRGAR